MWIYEVLEPYPLNWWGCGKLRRPHRGPLKIEETWEILPTCSVVYRDDIEATSIEKLCPKMGMQVCSKLSRPKKTCPELDRSIHDLANRYPGRLNKVPPKLGRPTAEPKIRLSQWSRAARLHPSMSWLFSRLPDRTNRSPRYLRVPEIGSHAVIGPAQFYATPAVVLNDVIFLARTNEARNGLVQISLRKIAQREFYIGWSHEALK